MSPVSVTGVFGKVGKAGPEAPPTTAMRVHFRIPEFVLRVQSRDVFAKHCDEAIQNVHRGNPVEKAPP